MRGQPSARASSEARQNSRSSRVPNDPARCVMSLEMRMTGRPAGYSGVRSVSRHATMPMSLRPGARPGSSTISTSPGLVSSYDQFTGGLAPGAVPFGRSTSSTEDSSGPSASSASSAAVAVEEDGKDDEEDHEADEGDGSGALPGCTWPPPPPPPPPPPS
jgi:hypothetical protein